MTLEEEIKLLEFSDFLPEKMREAKITADRGKCRIVLGLMILERNRPSTEWRVNLKWLSESAEIDEPECQEILSELANVGFAEKYGKHYVPSDEIVAAWEAHVAEAEFGR